MSISSHFLSLQQIYTCGRRHEAFESYYECHCKKPARLATGSFYLGTSMLIIAAALLQFTRWTQGYANLGAGIVFVVIAGMGLLSFLVINIFIDTGVRTFFLFSFFLIPNSLCP